MLLVRERVGFRWIFVLSDVLLTKNLFLGTKANSNSLIKCSIDLCDHVCDQFVHSHDKISKEDKYPPVFRKQMLLLSFLVIRPHAVEKLK